MSSDHVTQPRICSRAAKTVFNFIEPRKTWHVHSFVVNHARQLNTYLTSFFNTSFFLTFLVLFYFMASAGPPAGRRLIESLKPFRRRPVCAFLISKHSLRNSRQSCRSISTVSSQLSEMEVDDQTPPRWSQTPPQMKAPVSINRNPKVFEVNTNPRKLDDAYIRFLGQGGDKMLSDETKWLAVTHKSFDHGRRGFNDRLAYLGTSEMYWRMRHEAYCDNPGKHILELQTSLGMISTSTSAHPKNMDDPYGRVPFSHPATESVETLIGRTRTWFTYHKQLSNLSVRYGIPDVVRWQPRLVIPKT